MLACRTEVASAAWRSGMIEGLSRGLALVAEEDLGDKALVHALVKRFNQLTPAAYRRYVQAYLHQGELYGIAPKLLSFWQWRYIAADLAEIVTVADLLGCAPGFWEEEARGALLLDDATPSSGPYQSLLQHGGPYHPEPHFHDGLVDAYGLCWQLLHDGRLDNIQYCATVMQHLDLFWPADYKLYRSRFAGERRLTLSTHAAHRHPGDEWPLEYSAWSELVCEVTAELDRCAGAGERLSRRGRDLGRRLLCEENEPLPSCDWTLPERLEKELP